MADKSYLRQWQEKGYKLFETNRLNFRNVLLEEIPFIDRMKNKVLTEKEMIKKIYIFIMICNAATLIVDFNTHSTLGIISNILCIIIMVILLFSLYTLNKSVNDYYKKPPMSTVLSGIVLNKRFCWKGCTSKPSALVLIENSAAMVEIQCYSKFEYNSIQPGTRVLIVQINEKVNLIATLN